MWAPPRRLPRVPESSNPREGSPESRFGILFAILNAAMTPMGCRAACGLNTALVWVWTTRRQLNIYIHLVICWHLAAFCGFCWHGRRGREGKGRAAGRRRQTKWNIKGIRVMAGISDECPTEHEWNTAGRGSYSFKFNMDMAEIVVLESAFARD